MHAGSIQVRLLGILVIGVISSLIACSGGGSSSGNLPAPNSGGTPGVSVSLSPGTLDVTAGTQVSLTATVSGTTDASVAWSVDGVPNGNATVGTISGSGRTVGYSAPGVAGNHTVTVTSSADATKQATCMVNVLSAGPGVSVSLSPGATTLSVGATQSFTATVSNAADGSVTWFVDTILHGNADVGLVTGTGTTIAYTAPATPGSHTLEAVSVADGTKTASSTITVQAGSAGGGVALSPSAALLVPGANLSLTAAGLAGADAAWAVDGVANGNGAIGILVGSGLTRIYTAPVASGAHTISVTSSADATKTRSCVVTVQAVVVPTGIVVAPNGVATNPGTEAAPTTLEGARALIQKASRATAGTLRVLLRGGLYSRSTTFTLGAADSGSTANPVEYAAYPNEIPRLMGGVAIPATAVHPVAGTDPNWSRLDATARPFIYVVDLTAYKASLGTFASRNDSAGGVNQAMEVFVNGAPLTLARYPKAADPSTAVTAPHASIHVSGTLSPDVTGDYAYKGLDSKGRPYYQLAKGGDLWSIAASATGPDWRLSNRHDLGGTGSNAYWGSWESFAAPAGAFADGPGATGTALLSPTDGSSAIPGFMLIRGTNGTTQITAPDSHMSRWRASEAMYFGLGYYSWSSSHSTLTSLDPTTGSLVLSGSPTYGLRVGQPFFVYNLLEELTAPGDYFIDRVNARLYLRPAGDVAPTEVLISTLQGPIVQMTSCQHVTWQGVTFEAAKDRLVSASSCQTVSFKACQFRNGGGDGLTLGGSSNLVEGCDFRNLGKGGAALNGGNRTTLTPSGTVIENCEVQNFGRLFWTYQPGIDIDANSVGITVQYNELHHAPHAAITWGGNEHTIRYNLIHDVTQWTNDAGAIYTTGRDWGMQGNRIQFNLIRNCGGALGVYQSGIYVDGVGSGVKLEGNILYYAGPLFAIQHNGGRDVQSNYNISVGQWYGVDISNVAFDVVNNTAGSPWNLPAKLVSMNYQSAPWSTAYPNVAVIPSSWSLIAGSHWLQPEGSSCYGNLQQGPSGDVYRQHNSVSNLAAPTSWFTQVGENLSQTDPLFVDASTNDFRLQPGSPMFKVPGFPGIDVTQIGIRR